MDSRPIFVNSNRTRGFGNIRDLMSFFLLQKYINLNVSLCKIFILMRIPDRLPLVTAGPVVLKVHIHTLVQFSFVHHNYLITITFAKTHSFQFFSFQWVYQA
jgi:hypothetical protein